MKHSEPEHGNILVFTDDERSARRLVRWIKACGEHPVVLSGKEKFLIRSGDDETVDLVVTDLDTADQGTHPIFDRLLSGDLFPGVPQLHLLRDAILRKKLLDTGSAAAAVSLPAPPEALEFQGRLRLSAEVGRLRRELQRSTIRESMTGLFNRQYVMLRLDQEFSRARRYRTSLSVVLFDIDNLGRINERHGQAAGDLVIRRVGQALQEQVRKEDVLGRIGENSFGAVLSGGRYRGAAVFANKARTDVEELTVRHEGRKISITLSTGLSSYPACKAVKTAGGLLRRAEGALREAKARGGNRVFVDEAVLRSEQRLALVADADPRLLSLADDLLSVDDYRVVRAQNAGAALAALRVGPPDLLILDLQLSEENGGRPLMENIRQMFPGRRFPIIGLSRDPGTDPKRLARLGIDRLLTKPFSVSLLRSMARELLDGEPAA